MSNFKSYAIICAAYITGGGSLILFYLFLFFGSFNLFNFGMGYVQVSSPI